MVQSWATMAAADLTEIVSDMNSTLVWGSQSVVGTRSEWTKDLDAEAEGILNAESCEWAGKISLFTSSILPAVKVDVTIDGVKAHIISREENQDGVQVLFQLRRKVTVN